MPARNDPVTARLARLRQKLKPRGAPALLVTDPVNVTYLSGFTGDDSWLIAGAGRPCLITDFRYAEQAEHECPGARRVIRRGAMVEALAKVVRQRRLSTLGFDPDSVSVALRARLAKALKDVRLVPVPEVLSSLRARKDEGEVKAIRRAVGVAEEAFREFRRKIRPGMTEGRLAAELDHQMRLAGAECPAFPTICAVDASASMPHHRPGPKRLRRGSVLLVDFGARVAGYVCDLTRVLFAGRIRLQVRWVYGLVQDAQAAAIEKAGPGVPLIEVDKAARKIIQDAGYNDCFQHGTGHGLGMAVHEPPSIGPKGVKGNLELGMVVTVEPGIYLRGRFGIRIEDDVLVTGSGRQVLTHLEKDLAAMVL